MADITLIPSAKVPLIYDGELTMTTEWYRFFWNIYGFTGTGVVPVNKGGTGLNTIGDHQLIIGNAAGVFEKTELIGSGITITYAPGTTTLAIGNSGVTPGTYGSASAVGQFTVDAKGTLVFAQNVTIGIDATQIISGTIASARISGSYTGITGVGTLTAGTWNATTIGTAYGGTGLTSFTSGGALYATSSSVLTSGTLPTTAGGTGLISFNSGGALYATSTSALTSGTLPVTAGGTGQTSFTNGQLLIGNTTGNTLTKATLTAGSGVTITNGTGSITISATGSGGTVTAVTGVAPIASSGGTTPAISISQSNTTTDGYLSSTDWNTFNNKQPAGTYVTSVTGTAPVVSSGGTTPAISMAAASASTNGYLTSTDWSTFNGKQPAGTYVTSISIASSNGFTGTSSGGATPSLTLATSITGILKGNGTAISAATSGTDYAPATSGTSILYGDGAGGFSNVTIGTGVSFAGGTLSATGTGGTVTSVAALTLGTTGTDLSSTVANGTTTPVITLQVPTASAANRGALSAADWSTFNSKAPGVTFTTGYVPFGQGTTTLNQDAALFWDNTNKRLGIGTSSPSAPLSVSAPTGAIALSSTTGTNYALLAVANTGGSLYCGLESSTGATLFTGTSAYSGILGTTGAYPMAFATNNAERARFDGTTGYFGVGTNNPTFVISAYGATTSIIQAVNTSAVGAGAGAGIVAYTDGTPTAADQRLGFYLFGSKGGGAGNYNSSGILSYASQAWTIGSAQGSYLTFATTPTGSATRTEAMRIFSSSGVSIGNTTDPGATNLSVTGTGYFGGNVLIGQTSGSDGKLRVWSAANNVVAAGFRSANSGDVAQAQVVIGKYDNNSTTSQVFQIFTINNGAGGAGQINGNGASQAAFGSFSDKRLKENIANLPSQLDNILNLRPVEFDYIESEGGGHQIGFIAQEMQAVYPDAVGERQDGMLTVTGWAKTEARLVKAIQELNDKFDAYVASHP